MDLATRPLTGGGRRTAAPEAGSAGPGGLGGPTSSAAIRSCAWPAATRLGRALQAALLITLTVFVASLIWHIHLRPAPVAYIDTGSAYVPVLRPGRAGRPTIIVPGGIIAVVRMLRVREVAIGQRLVTWTCNGIEYGRQSSPIGFVPPAGGDTLVDVIELKVPLTVPRISCRVDATLILERPPFRRDAVSTEPIELRVGEPARSELPEH